MNALALRSASGLPAQRAGSGTAMQTRNGGVSAFFALEAFDPRLGMAIYSLQVMNYTTATLVCRVWAIAHDGHATLAYPVLVEVLPGSTLDTEIPLLPATLPHFERTIVEVAGEGVHCLVEAPPPIAPIRSKPYPVVAASFLAGMALLGTIAGIRSAMPRIDAFALPPQTLAGTTVRAEYAAGGSGTLSYSVLAPDGSTLQGGSVPNGTGSIPIGIPANSTGAYTVQMVMSGPFGRATETRVLNTLAVKPHTAQIANISIHPITARAGETVTASYTAVGDGGYVRLIGGDGTIWGDHVFSRSGQTSFVVPPVAVGTQLQVQLHVTKGNSSAQSVAGFVVAGSTAPAPVAAAPAAQLVSSDDPNAVPGVTSNDDNGTFDVLTKTAKSGGTISVKILSPRNGMRVSLMDTQSHEVSGLDVGSDATVVTLHAPVVAVPTKYIVEASFTDGFGQETIVQPVTVSP